MNRALARPAALDRAAGWRSLRRGLPLLAILVVALAVRFPALPQKGIVHWDEAMYLQQARFVASAARALLARIGLTLPEGQFLRPREGFEIRTRWGDLRGDQNYYPKPGQTALLSFGMLVLGEYPWAGQAVSVFFGVLTVALVSTMARSVWGAPAATLSAAALAVSGWHTLYSAEALPEVNGLFFVTLALFIYWRALRRPQMPQYSLATGAIMGGAFAVFERAVFVIPALALGELIVCLRVWLAQPRAGGENAPWTKVARVSLLRIALVMSAFGLVIGLVAGLLALLGFMGSATGVNMPGLQVDYVQRIIQQYQYGVRSAALMADLPSLLIFPYLTWHWDGPLLPGLAMLGLAVALALRRSEEASLVAVFLVFYVYFSLSPRGAAHYLLPIALPVAMLAGRCVTLVPQRAQAGVAVGLTIVLALWQAPHAAALAAIPSGYQPASETAIRETGGKHLSNYWAMTQYYTGSQNARWPQEGMESVRRAVADGFWLAIVASPHDDPAQIPAWEEEGLAGAHLMAVIPNPAAAALSNTFGGDRRGTFHEALDRTRRASSEIRIYDLRPLVETVGIMRD